MSKKASDSQKFNIDKEQIRLFWKFINHRNKTHKFQVFKKDGSVTIIKNVTNVKSLINHCKSHNLEGISCLSVNPAKPESMKTGDILEINNILIDIDVRAERKENGVSIKEDKKIALETAQKIKKKLEEEINLRVSLLVDSGNGYHLYVPIHIDLSTYFTGKNENENKVLWDSSDIKARLISLENLLKEFNNNVCQIDCISKDIARRVKISGTWNVKEGISEKNYRLSKIIEPYDNVLIDVSIEGNTTVFNGIEIKKPEVYEITGEKTDLRPCFKTIIRRNIQLKGGTGHNLRYALLNELMACGYSDSEIHAVFRRQTDYKENIVQTRINELRKNRNFKPYKCDTLKKKFDEINFSLENFCEKCPLEIKRKEKKVERLVRKDMDEFYGQAKVHDYINDIMDTREDKEKFKVLKSLSGIITNDDKEIFYQTVFAKKQGRCTPVVLTSNESLHPVKNRANILIKHSMDLMTEEYKDENGNPIYKKLKDVPEEERYQFFEYNNVTYKFIQSVFWDDSHNIQTIDNNAIHDVINKKEYNKQIFKELRNIIKEYFFHTRPYEYDVLGTAAVISYIAHVLGNVFYLCFLGGMGTGKSTTLSLLSFLQFNGRFSGKGTVPSSVRLIHFHGISLNQDEFEKMNKEEKTMIVNVFNTGFNSYGVYTLTNMGIKDVRRQIISMKTFGMKSFTCNSLTGFDPSFIDRLYVILSIKTNMKLKNIYRLSAIDLKRFQDVRNKLFVYCLFHWREIRDDIDEMRNKLEGENVFGRETDKNSIILGVIKHFSGDVYAGKVKIYIQQKAPVLQLEHVKTMECIVLNTIVSKCMNEKTSFVDVLNKELYTDLLSQLGMSADNKYAPSHQKPRKILDSLGLTGRKENLGKMHGGNRVFHINTDELVNVLESNNYTDLLKKILWKTLITPLKPLTAFTKNGDDGEESEDGEEKYTEHLIGIDLSKYEMTIRRIENIVGNEQLPPFQIARRMNKTKLAEIAFIEGLLKEVVSEDSIETTLKVDSKGYYFNVNNKFEGD